jgi:hypothetical protein
MIPPSPDGRYPAYRPPIHAVRNVFDDFGNISACGICSDPVDLDDNSPPSLFGITPWVNRPRSTLTAALGKA